MFCRFRLVILGLAIIAVAGTNLCAQRTPRQRGWSYSGDPRAERTPNFRLPMEAIFSANTPEDLIRAGTQPGRTPAPRAIAKPETLPPAPSTQSLPDEEVDPFADDPADLLAGEAAPANEPAVAGIEPAAPADDGMTGSQLLGVLGDVAGSFLPDTSRVTEALPQLPGGGAMPPGAELPGSAPPEMGMPPAAGASETDPFSAPAEGDDPFGEPTPEPASEPGAESPELEADPFQ